jgi:hypothetical protein
MWIMTSLRDQYSATNPLIFYRELSSFNTRPRSIIFTSLPILRKLIAVLLIHKGEKVENRSFLTDQNQN